MDLGGLHRRDHNLDMSALLNQPWSAMLWGVGILHPWESTEETVWASGPLVGGQPVAAAPVSMTTVCIMIPNDILATDDVSRGCVMSRKMFHYCLHVYLPGISPLAIHRLPYTQPSSTHPTRSISIRPWVKITLFEDWDRTFCPVSFPYFQVELPSSLIKWKSNLLRQKVNSLQIN